MRRNSLDRRRKPGFDRAINELQTVETHQSRRNVGFARHDENRLPETALLEHKQNSGSAPNVQLRKWIIKEQQRLSAGVVAQSRRLEHFEGDGGRALL